MKTQRCQSPIESLVGVIEGKVSKLHLHPREAPGKRKGSEGAQLLAYLSRLQHLVPESSSSRPSSKLQIIQSVIDYIYDLEGVLLDSQTQQEQQGQHQEEQLQNQEQQQQQQHSSDKLADSLTDDDDRSVSSPEDTEEEDDDIIVDHLENDDVIVHHLENDDVIAGHLVTPLWATDPTDLLAFNNSATKSALLVTSS